MAKTNLSSEAVEREISRLENSPMVKLARMYEQVKFQRRQLLHELQQLEKKGFGLAAAGFSLDMLRELMGGSDYAE